MSRALFYLDVVPAAGEPAELRGEEGFHAATVRRIRPGEEIDLGDGAGTVGHCRVERTGKDSLVATVLDRRVVAPPVPRVTVVQALPKADRSELAVELATEAGTDALLAWQARRCVARWDGAAKQAKALRRWQAVARAAARQSRRAHLPAVDGPVTTPALVALIAERTAAGTAVLLAHEEAAGPLADVPGVGGAEAVWLVVGPEGGIGADEVAELTGAGATPVRLGPTVLRTSTAAAVALGALGVLTPRWR